MRPDIARRGRTEQRVDNGVYQHIGVRVAEQSHVMWNVDSPDDEWTTWHQGVDIPALANAQRKDGSGHVRLRRMASAKAKSSG